MAMLASTPSRANLARAGWGVVSGSRLPGLPTPPPTPPRNTGEEEGKRLVTEVASFWTAKYIFHIRQGGRRDGLYHYECLFSRPTDDRPVPSVVIAVQFAFLPAVGSQAPRMFFQFEQGDLRHEWKMCKDSGGRWHPERGQQILSLKHGAFERYLDTYIREKDVVRTRGINLCTAFEKPRLQPPPAFVYDHEPVLPDQPVGLDRQATSRTDLSQGGSQGSFSQMPEANREIALAMRGALKAANMYCDKIAAPSSLPELLANILDAADEDGSGRMSHYEVSRLLMATLPGFGLQEWDIHHLLTYAKEDDEGFINSSALVSQAEAVVISLRRNRQSFIDRRLPGAEVSDEAIKHCFGEEIALTVEQLMKLCEARASERTGRGLYLSAVLCSSDLRGGSSRNRRSGSKLSAVSRGSKDCRHARGGGGGNAEDSISVGDEDDEKELVALHRYHFRHCLQALHERISTQEAAMLLQMLPEDENGYVSVDELSDRIEQLRTEALLNAVIACDVKALRTHMVTKFREAGMDEFGRMKLWRIKDGLLGADEVCLSRSQIHILLCLATPDNHGNVDMNIFAAICSSIVPHLCNAKIFSETAERLMVEHAEAAKEHQNAELAALGAARVSAADDDDPDERVEKKTEADQETVERTLIQVFSLSDDTRKSTPVLPPETIFKLMFNSTDQQVQSLGLDDLEVAGLVAEMQPDANGEVPYHDFVKRWVPILFEIRKNPHLGAYLQPGAAEHLGFPEPDLVALESLFPLLPLGHSEAMLSRKAQERAASQMTDPALVQRGPGRRGSKTLSRRKSSLSPMPSLEPDDEEVPASVQKGKTRRRPD